MKTLDAFFNELSSLSSYAQQVEFIRPVTHSTRMAMLWLYLKLGIIPPADFKCREEELLFLWRYMPNSPDTESLSGSVAINQRKVDHDRLAVVRMWIGSAKFSAPIMQERIVPGMSKALLLGIFDELLKAHLQPKKNSGETMITT